MADTHCTKLLCLFWLGIVVVIINRYIKVVIMPKDVPLLYQVRMCYAGAWHDTFSLAVYHKEEGEKDERLHDSIPVYKSNCISVFTRKPHTVLM